MAQMRFGVDLAPSGTRSLGLTGSRWENIYANNINGVKPILIAGSATSIPSAGNSVTISITGLTANHYLVAWNFSSSAENNPPVNLSWNTSSGSCVITNNGGSTSETIQPIFVAAV